MTSGEGQTPGVDHVRDRAIEDYPRHAEEHAQRRRSQSGSVWMNSIAISFICLLVLCASRKRAIITCVSQERRAEENCADIDV